MLRMKQNSKNKQYNCANIEELTQKYLDHYLSEEELKSFNEHLEYCLPCDKKIEFELKLKELVKANMQVNASQNFIRAKIKKMLSNL